jgi:hypothetical protein
MARLLAPPNRGSYPRQFLANPYRGRVQLAGFGRLGDDASDFSAAINAPLPFSAPAPTDFSALTAAQDSSYLPAVNAAAATDPIASLNFAPGFGPNAADSSDQFAALTAQQDSTYLPAVNAAAAASPSAKPSTPAQPSNSSVDWSKIAAGLVTAGGTVAAGAIKAKGASDQARAAQAAQQSALARAAALAKGGLKTATSSSGMMIIGGVAVVGLVLFLALRK